MSKSKSKNAVREETRKRVERKFKEETERLRADNKDLRVRLIKAERDAYEAQENAEKLQEQLRVQKEWIERLMDFVNMPDEERHKAIKKYVEHRKMTQDFEALFAPYFKVLNRLNLIF